MFSHILYNVRRSHRGHTGHEYKRGDLFFAPYLFNRNGGIYYINNVFESPCTTTAAVVRMISRFGIADNYEYTPPLSSNAAFFAILYRSAVLENNSKKTKTRDGIFYSVLILRWDKCAYISIYVRASEKKIYIFFIDLIIYYIE